MTMKMTVGHVFQAAETVAAIINQNRPMPQKGSYRLARMFAKLKPEYDLIAARRDEMIEEYGHKAMVPGPKTADDPLGQNLVPAENFSVPPEDMPKFTKDWAEVANEEIDVNVEPMPLAYFDRGDGTSVITAAELIFLDDLVTED